jgi:phage gp46-like protein
MILGEALLTIPPLGDDVVLPLPLSIPLYAPVNPVIPTDIASVWIQNLGGADFRIVRSELRSNQDLETSVIISLFSDRLANSDDLIPDPFSTNRRGWWADTYNTELIGSRLWLLSRAKSSPALLPIAQGYVQEALQWLIDDKVVSSMDIQVFFIHNAPSMLGIVITLFQKGQNKVAIEFEYVWNQISR